MNKDTTFPISALATRPSNETTTPENDLVAIASEIEGVLPDLFDSMQEGGREPSRKAQRDAIEDFVGDWLCDHRPSMPAEERQRIRKALAKRWV